jgi:hypothetical protein
MEAYQLEQSQFTSGEYFPSPEDMLIVFEDELDEISFDELVERARELNRR